MGLVQLCTRPIAFILDELQKNEIHLFVFALFLLFFVKFWCISCNIMAKKSYKPTCLVFTFNSRRHHMTSIEHYVSQSPISFIGEVAYA